MRTWKQPNDSRLFTYDFSELLAGRTINSVLSVNSVARSGGSTLTQEGVPIVSSSAVQIEWSGGVEAMVYLTTVRVDDSQGEEHELEGEILVVDIGFALPSGIASAYLTAEDYVARFGYEETVRITDEDRKGIIDGGKLSNAINDATQLAESYIGVRYTLPLNPVPPVIKGIIADLAREKLFGQRPLLQVTAAADRARAMLKDLSAGRMALPDQTGEELPQTAAGQAETSGTPHQGRVFTSESMCGFGIPPW